MIVERLTFQAKYGHGDELVAVLKDISTTMRSRGIRTGGRIYTDLTGTMFTVEIENEFADLDAYAKFFAADTAMFGDQAFQALFAKMMAATDGGKRQLLNVETV